MKARLLAALLIMAGTSSGLLADTRVANANEAAARAVTIPAGTLLRVRLTNHVASDTSRVEDRVNGQLASPIVVGGRTIVQTGSPISGYVTSVKRSARVKGRASIAMRFNRLTDVDDDRTYRISTGTWSRVAPATKEKDAAKIAIPAAGGAVVGAIVGGKKGAAIGAAAGGGGGTAVVLATRGKEVRLGPGAVLQVRLSQPLTVYAS
jgi:hypothetical protein